MSTAVQLVNPLIRPPDVTLGIPGSKSHTNRALLCAALAPGQSELRRVLFADDTEAMLGALAALGVSIDADPVAGRVRLNGGIAGDRSDGTAPDELWSTANAIAVDVRKSGTTGRFLLPMLAATPGHFVLDGHEQLRSRPFGPQLEALRSLGAEVIGDGLPLRIAGRRLTGAPVEVASSISSQYLSGLLLSAPLFEGTTTVTVAGELVSRPYIDLTIDTMAAFGVPVRTETVDGAQTFIVTGSAYKAATLELEPDASAASYFFAAAAITGGRVRIEGLGNETVQGDLRFVEVLKEMGAEVRSGSDWTEVAGTGTLRGVTVDMADISDTAQTLAVVAAFADSPTTIDGIGFIRFKETDRIGAVVTELSRRGLDVRETDDGMVINPGVPTPGRVDTYEDHRMAMSFALLGLVHPGIEIDNPGCVDKTFPDFFEVLDRLR